MTESGPNPPREASLPPGYDEDDPYADENLERYPDWWRTNIERFREHKMRPYRPPQFKDGNLVTPVIERLEDDLDVNIQIRTTNPTYGGAWDVCINGTPTATVERSRNSEGRTVYALTADQFESIVRPDQ